MEITYDIAGCADIEPIYQMSKQLVDDYENTAQIAYEKVLGWIRKKIEEHIGEYAVILADGEKAGYYRFGRNEDGRYEIDDLCLFPEFRNKGIGSRVIRDCCAQTDEPIMLYVFVRNRGAVRLYERLGFRIAETIRNSRYIMINAEPVNREH